MTQTPPPPDPTLALDAAVRIAAEAVVGSVSVRLVTADRVVEALARAGWLHDPAEIDRLRNRVAELEEDVARCVD